jgi:hypothetical protein
MSFVVQGVVHAVMPEQTIKPTLRKREFVLVYAENPNYPQYLKFDLFNDKCGLIEGYLPGERVEVSFNLRGREWVNPRGEKVYITSLEGWRITRQAQQRNAAPPPPANENTFEGGDLPF